jgi:hypothetical protein
VSVIVVEVEEELKITQLPPSLSIFRTSPEDTRAAFQLSLELYQATY